MRKTKIAALAALTLCAFAVPSLPATASTLVSLMTHDVGMHRPAGCPTAWCACYLDKMLKKAGLPVLNSFAARDFAHYGRKAKAGQVGAIMVMPHHVGVVSGSCGGGKVRLVSGNHGHRVGTGCYAMSRAIAWRLPA